MGFFKKLGNAARSVLGGKASGGTFKKHGTQPPASPGKLRETFEGMYPETPGTLRPAIEAWEFPGQGKTIDEQLYDAQVEIAARELNESIGRNKLPTDPRERFLAGELTSVSSTNVDTIQYIAEDRMLYIGFKNLMWYAYYNISIQEAEALWDAPSKGGWVWDTLRVRGTVFGRQKDYAFMDGPSNAEPKYHQSQKWREEHGSIPESGETPSSWQQGEGPYPAWYGVPRAEAEGKPKK